MCDTFYGKKIFNTVRKCLTYDNVKEYLCLANLIYSVVRI